MNIEFPSCLQPVCKFGNENNLLEGNSLLELVHVCTKECSLASSDIWLWRFKKNCVEELANHGQPGNAAEDDRKTSNPNSSLSLPFLK